MSWIDEIDVDDAEGKLETIYAELVKKRGKVSNILKVHSLNPEALSDHLDIYMTLMFGPSGLSRLEREAIAVVVSATNETESDLGELRAVELSDKDILDLSLITAYFNFVNRIALALGVDFSADEMHGYRDD